MNTDLWGNEVQAEEAKEAKPKREWADTLMFSTHCYLCGKRIRAEDSVPVAFHADYCRTCYDIYTNR